MLDAKELPHIFARAVENHDIDGVMRRKYQWTRIRRWLYSAGVTEVFL